MHKTSKESNKLLVIFVVVFFQKSIEFYLNTLVYLDSNQCLHEGFVIISHNFELDMRR